MLSPVYRLPQKGFKTDLTNVTYDADRRILNKILANKQTKILQNKNQQQVKKIGHCDYVTCIGGNSQCNLDKKKQIKRGIRTRKEKVKTIFICR